MEICPLEMLVTTRPQCRIPEDLNLQWHHRDELVVIEKYCLLMDS